MDFMDSLEPESIDLIYIDPPFFCQRDFKNKDGIGFSDKWPSREAYLNFMRARLDKMAILLKDTGVLALHCDQRINHHLRMMLDAVFGEKNFVNEIIWSYRGRGCLRELKYYRKKHDVIFIYAKGVKYFSDVQKGPLSKSTLDRFKKLFNKNGVITEKRMKEMEPGSYNTRVRHGLIKGIDNRVIYDKNRGAQFTDVWSDLPTVPSNHSDYPTQKPEKLLERIVKSFCPEDGTVADFFCGSGATLVAAQKLNRKYLGCDANPDAIKIANRRLIEEILK